MSEPADLDPDRRGGTWSAVATGLLVALGIVLLLPGLCTVVMAVQMLTAEEFKSSDPYLSLVLTAWGICIAIALAGVLLLRLARRRIRRSAGR